MEGVIRSAVPRGGYAPGDSPTRKRTLKRARQGGVAGPQLQGVHWTAGKLGRGLPEPVRHQSLCTRELHDARSTNDECMPVMPPSWILPAPRRACDGGRCAKVPKRTPVPACRRDRPMRRTLLGTGSRYFRPAAGTEAPALAVAVGTSARARVVGCQVQLSCDGWL